MGWNKKLQNLTCLKVWFRQQQQEEEGADRRDLVPVQFWNSRHFWFFQSNIEHFVEPVDFWRGNALCSKSNGRCDIKAEKREELESKSSHKSDIWLPAASKKWGEIYWKYIFQTLEAIFPYKGVFVTKVVKANIIAFIKTKILRPVLSVTNPPFQKCQPLLHSALMVLLT